MSFQSMLESNECGQTNPMIDLARQLAQSSSTSAAVDNSSMANAATIINESMAFDNSIRQHQQSDNTSLSSAVESLLLNSNGGGGGIIDDSLESSAFNMESLLNEMNRMESKILSTVNDDDQNVVGVSQPPDSIRSLLKTEQDPFWNEIAPNLMYDDNNDGVGFNQQQQQHDNKLPELNVDWADEYLRKLELNNNNNNDESSTIKVSNVQVGGGESENQNGGVDGSWDLNEKVHQIQTDQCSTNIDDNYRQQSVDNVEEFFPQQSYLPFLRPVLRRQDFGTSTAISDANLNDLVSDQESRLINMLLGNNQTGENISLSSSFQTTISPPLQQPSVIGSMAKVEIQPEKTVDIDIRQGEMLMTDGQSSQQLDQQQPPTTATKSSIKLDNDQKMNENFFYENQFDDMEFWMKLAEEWHSNDITGGDLLADVDQNVVQIREPLENLLKSDHRYNYKLMENNPFVVSSNESSETKNNDAVESQNYIEQGKQRMQIGDLSAAVLLFEAAAKQQSENIEAWYLLGIANAKNENDHKSIAAFKRCLSLQPKDEQIILDSLMYLAASFTNESMTTEACNALQEWLNNHPKYRDLANKESDEPYLGPTPLSKRWIQKTARIGNPFSNGLFDSLRETFIEAAQLSTTDEQSDPDVQCGLGILHNLSGEYEKAIDCFRLALESRPDDYLLWNRYGASLANGGRAEESMSAYREALIRYPGYIRARYNLAISCMMMGFGEEAAEHLLSVLQLQNAGADSIKDMVDLNRDNITSTSIWSLLRSAMSMHGRIELLDLVDKRDLELLIKEFQQKPKSQETENDDDDEIVAGNDNEDGNHENQSNID